MTQQPYQPQPAYQPQQAPQQYQQAPPVQFQQPQYPTQYPPQQPYQQAGPPQAPLAQGSIADFYAQPSTGGGKSVSWAGKPDGFTVAGQVTRNVADSDVIQETEMRTGVPQFYNDGRPKFVMKVPLSVQPSQDHPNGDATLYVKTQLRDELSRAMQEAGCPDGNPRKGDVIYVTLVQRKPSGAGLSPSNVFSVAYQRADGGQAAPQQQAPQQPVQQAPQYAPPAQQPVQQQAQPQVTYQDPNQGQGFAAQQVQQYAQQIPQQAQQAPPPQWAQPQQEQQAPPVQQYATGVDPNQAAPQGGPVPPPGLSPHAAGILQGLTNPGQQPQPQQ